jgi:hypothetical protein
MRKYFGRIALVGSLALFASCGGSSDSSNIVDIPENVSASFADEYSAEVNTTFVNGCVANGGDTTTCQCVFDYIADQMSFDRFTDMEIAIKNGASTEEFPIFSNAMESCAE